MKRTKRLLKIVIPIVAIILTLAFALLDALWAWIEPLPNTVQEQVDNAIGRSIDGIIVYVDKQGNNPKFYSAGWMNKENKIPAIPDFIDDPQLPWSDSPKTSSEF